MCIRDSRNTADGVASLASSYLKETSAPVSAILRPTYPDCIDQDNLIQKVEALKSLEIKNIDFYLLDTFRPRDLTWVKKAIA